MFTMILNNNTVAIKNNAINTPVEFYTYTSRRRALRVYLVEAGRLERQGLLASNSIILN